MCFGAYTYYYENAHLIFHTVDTQAQVNAFMAR